MIFYYNLIRIYCDLALSRTRTSLQKINKLILNFALTSQHDIKTKFFLLTPRTVCVCNVKTKSRKEKFSRWDIARGGTMETTRMEMNLISNNLILFGKQSIWLSYMESKWNMMKYLRHQSWESQQGFELIFIKYLIREMWNK
jgi:hypothetical protein